MFNRLASPTQDCLKGKNIGKIEGMRCPCICCVGEKKINCKQNIVTLSDICTDGKQLRFHYQNSGTEIPAKIHIELSGKNNAYAGEQITLGDAFLSNDITHPIKENDVIYEAVSQFHVTFKDAPFSTCVFPPYDMKKPGRPRAAFPIRACQ